MAKKKNKKKKGHKSYFSPVVVKSVSSENIRNIAFQVFGSLYYSSDQKS